MFELQGIGPKKIKAVWDKLGVTTRRGLLKRPARMGASRRCRALEKRPRTTFSRRSRRGRNTRDVSGSATSRHDAEAMLDDLREHPDVNRVQRVRQLPAAEGDRRRSRFPRLDERARRRSRIFSSKHEMVESVIAHGATKSSVRLKIRHPGRSARGEGRGVSVCAELLHRLEGAQHHHAPARARPRLDAE